MQIDPEELKKREEADNQTAKLIVGSNVGTFVASILLIKAGELYSLFLNFNSMFELKKCQFIILYITFCDVQKLTLTILPLPIPGTSTMKGFAPLQRLLTLSLMSGHVCVIRGYVIMYLRV